MNLDFTHKKFYQLCDAIADNYHTMTVAEYLSSYDLIEKFVIMRHDVDNKPKNSLKIARIEKEFDIRATYYFRMNSNVLNPEIIQELVDIGHEVGYHYEVLGKLKGDRKKAIELFKYELREFRKICDVRTICMHGNPLSKYDNRDLWKSYDFRDFGILGEAYLSVGKNINYFSDTGRWNPKNNVRDFVLNNNEKLTVNNTDSLIALIKSNKINNLYILTHPERWTEKNMEWGFNYMRDLVFNTGKKFLIARRRHEGDT